MLEKISYDSTWEDRYRDNPSYRNHYPWSSVVSFIHNNRPKNKQPYEIKILEVGCGNGNNLWFAAREGFSVSGIDCSQTAIDYAKQWFAREGLIGDFRVGQFTDLPFKDRFFDLVIDRSALTFCSNQAINKAFDEIWRVLQPSGVLLFNPLSDRCSSFDGLPDIDGCYRDITHGSIQAGTAVKFYSVQDIRNLFRKNWLVKKMAHNETMDIKCIYRTTHAEWLVEAIKMDSTD